MLDKGKCVSPGYFNESATGLISLRRAARLGTTAISLGAMMVLALMVSVPSAAAKGPGNEDLGQKTYKTTCVMCHGEDGKGTPTGKALKAPDLHSAAVQKMTDAQIAEQVANGKNNMPPFKSTLSKAQIAAVAKYVHTLGKKK
jgi:mono/diheme cytochrome c family protein